VPVLPPKDHYATMSPTSVPTSSATTATP
jgi:hypothetical protein